MTRRTRAPVLPAPAMGDECPDCKTDHRQLVNPARHYNPYTHTAKEPAMTITTPTPQPTPGALAIKDGQDFWDAKQVAALRQLGIQDAPNPDLAVFFHFCQRTGLDPFARQVTMISYGGRWTIQTEIDGYRAIAHRAARARRQIISYGPTLWYDGDGKEYPVWLKDGPPAAAKVSVYVDGAPFHGYASYREFVPRDKNGNPRIGPNDMWGKMPANQTAKCAEAQALRKAFPHDLADTITTDEAPSTLAGAAWNEPAPAIPARRRSKPHVDSGEQGINLPPAAVLAGIWERLGVVDSDEQLNLTAALAETDTMLDQLTDLPATELRRIIHLLEPCTEIGQVHQFIDTGEQPTDGG